MVERLIEHFKIDDLGDVEEWLTHGRPATDDHATVRFREFLFRNIEAQPGEIFRYIGSVAVVYA